MRLRRKSIFGLSVNCIVILLTLFFNTHLYAQTPGVIVVPATGAGKTVLDRNGDGYTSATNTGFTTTDYGVASEMNFTPIPQLGTEPNGDILRDPSCGFTDFVDDASYHNAVGVHLDSNGTYLVFRMRMAKISKNSKGFSILVDADGKFGSSGPYADPGYVAPTSSNWGNPGFEFEIQLATNFGVYIYNIDNTTTPSTTHSYTESTHSQKSVALSYGNACGSAYFVDFYVPVADLPSPYNNTVTKLRYAMTSVSSPHSAVQGPISDVGGVNDAAYANNDPYILYNIINAQAGTTLSNVTSMSSILQPPNVLSPIYNTATTIKVVNTDLATGYLTVYKTHAGVTSRLGIISSVASGATGILSSISVATGDIIWSTDSVPGGNVSLNSNQVTVAGLSCNKPTAPLITCYSGKGVDGTSIYSAATIKLYSLHNNLITSFTGGTTNSGGTYAWSYNPKTTGNANNACGTGSPSSNVYGDMYATITVNGCESIATYGSVAAGVTCTNTTTPSVTYFNYSTGVIKGTSTVATDSIAIFKNGSYIASVKAAANAWTYTGSSTTFLNTDTVRVGEFTSYTGCMSTRVLAMVPPVISGPVKTNSTSISGTSTAPSGTYVDIYKNGVAIGHTTVTSSGTWTLAYSLLAVGNTITAYDSLAGYKSAISNTVTVIAAPTSEVPAITGSGIGVNTIISNGTSVYGTLPTNATGGTITLYADGTQIGTVAVTSGVTTWQVTGLSSTKTQSLDNYLYAGTNLTATWTPSGGTEGGFSNNFIVQCNLPLTTCTITATKYKFCSTDYPSVTVSGSEAGVVYSMVKHGTSNLLGSMAGTGGTITIPGDSTFAQLKANTHNEIHSVSNESFIIDVTAMKVSPVSCSVTVTDTSYLREDCNAVYAPGAYSSGSSGHTFANDDVVATVSDADTSISTFSLSSGSLPPGTSLNTSNGNIYVSNSAALTSGTWTAYINTTDNHTFDTSDGITTTYGTSTPSVTISWASPLPVTLLNFSGEKNFNSIDLNWITASEINNAYFDIERSIDATQFDSKGTVPGHGTTNDINYYNFTDAAPLFGTSYYRLKQVDYNGAYNYSNIISFDLKSNNKTTVKIYPNPLVKPAVLHLEINTTDNEIIRTFLSDLTGQVVVQSLPQVVLGYKLINLDVSKLKRGFYFLKVQTSSEIIMEKIEIL